MVSIYNDVYYDYIIVAGKKPAQQLPEGTIVMLCCYVQGGWGGDFPVPGLAQT